MLAVCVQCVLVFAACVIFYLTAAIWWCVDMQVFQFGCLKKNEVRVGDWTGRVYLSEPQSCGSHCPL